MTTSTSSNAPLVSIGLPVYNGDDYLALTLDDMLAQSFADFELIISDNASTDHTEEICRSYAVRDARIRYVRQSKNVGGAPNHNIVYRLARGKYFKWLGHDDRHAPTYLARCVEPLVRDSGVALSYPKTLIIDEDGALVQHYEDGFHMTSNEPRIRYRRILEQPNSEYLNPSLGIFRTHIFAGRDPDGGYFASDRVILAEIALHGRFHEVPERLYSRRIYTRSQAWSSGSDEQVQAWFDPASKNKVLAPRWLRLMGYWQTIARVPMTPAARLGCYVELIRFYSKVDRVSGMLMDLRHLTRTLRKRVH